MAREFLPITTFEDQVLDWHNKHASGPEPIEERLRRFESYKKTLYWKAVDEYNEGKKNQYRGFGVGAAALAFRGDRHILNGQAEIFTGFNIMPEKGGEKHCAEKRLFEAAAAAGYTQIVGLVVVGEYQPDDTSGHECTTLHPCALCRNMMMESPLAWPEMPIVTAQPPDIDESLIDEYWEPVRERHTLAEILAIHDAKESE